jgi:hypothetical protein
MKIRGITLQLVTLCALFDASSALPIGQEVCSSQGSEYKNRDLGIVFIALCKDGWSGLKVYKAGQNRCQQDDRYESGNSS